MWKRMKRMRVQRKSLNLTAATQKTVISQKDLDEVEAEVVDEAEEDL